jgi:glycosyltransferase involved in cell wall biosynthesis
MNINFNLQRYCEYLIAIEAEHALREFATAPAPLPPPAIAFQHSHDPETELSILLPVWNPDPKQFDRCLRSLAGAKLDGINYEVIVSDNASDTDVVNRCLNQAKVPHLRYVRQPVNIGGFPNFNWCIAASRGSWLHLLSHDDWVEPDFYVKLLRGEAATSGSELRFCRTRICDETANQTRFMYDEAPTAGLIGNFLDRQCISQRIQLVGALFSRKAVEQVGGFDGVLGAGADWEYWVRISSKFPVFYHPEPLANYALHQGSWTNREAGGFADAESFRKYRRILQRILTSVPPEKRRAAAAGFMQNMLGRLIGISMENRKANALDANRQLGIALFSGCQEAGLLGDIEKVLLGLP